MQTQTQTQTANEPRNANDNRKVALRVYDIVKSFQPISSNDVTDLMDSSKTSASSTLSKLAKCGYLLVSKSVEHVSSYTGAPTSMYSINPAKLYNGEALPPSYVINGGNLRATNRGYKQNEIPLGNTITESIYRLVAKHQPITSAELVEMTKGQLKSGSVPAFMSQLAAAGYLTTVKREGVRSSFYITTSKPFTGVLPVAEYKRTDNSKDYIELEFDDAELSVDTEAPITPPQLEVPKPQPVNGVLKKKVVVTYEFMGKEYTEDELREVMTQLQSALGG